MCCGACCGNAGGDAAQCALCRPPHPLAPQPSRCTRPSCTACWRCTCWGCRCRRAVRTQAAARPSLCGPPSWEPLLRTHLDQQTSHLRGATSAPLLQTSSRAGWAGGAAGGGGARLAALQGCPPRAWAPAAAAAAAPPTTTPCSRGQPSCRGALTCGWRDPTPGWPLAPPSAAHTRGPAGAASGGKQRRRPRALSRRRQQRGTHPCSGVRRRLQSLAAAAQLARRRGSWLMPPTALPAPSPAQHGGRCQRRAPRHRLFLLGRAPLAWLAAHRCGASQMELPWAACHLLQQQRQHPEPLAWAARPATGR